MSYEDAPATRLLATHCACCSRPLVDAESVTAGIGPICREAHGVPRTLDEETRELANKLVYLIAAQQRGPEVEAALVQLAVLGCDKLVERIAKRLGSNVELEWTDRGEIIVRGPYNQAAVNAMRSVRGRRWDGAAKVNRFPGASRLAVLRAISEGYGEGTIVREVGRFAEPRLQPIATMIEAAEYDENDPEEREHQEEQEELARAQQMDAALARSLEATSDLPEVTPYDPGAAAACLITALMSSGFVQVASDGHTREQVWERVVAPKPGKPECGHRVRVFTSIVGNQMRSTGKDAVRVLGVVTFWSKRSGSWRLAAKALSRETRVHRTGTCEGIVNRTMARARAALQACLADIGGRQVAAAPQRSQDDWEAEMDSRAAAREEEWAHGRRD